MKKIILGLTLVVAINFIIHGQNSDDFEIKVGGSGAGQTITVTKYKGKNKNVLIPGYINGMAVTGISGDMFSNMSGLRSSDIITISIPKTVTAIEVRQFSSLFPNCRNILEISVEKDSQYYYSSNGVLFDRNAALLFYPPGKPGAAYTVPDGIEKIGDSAFDDSKLESVVLPEGLVEIDHHAFYGTGITSIVLPDSVEIIGDWAFTSSRISNINVPSSLKEVGFGAFNRCESITEKTILDYGQKFGSRVFYYDAHFDDDYGNWFEKTIQPYIDEGLMPGPYAGGLYD
jgi:hypothetical protein